MLILYSFFFFLFYTRSHQKEKQAKEKGIHTRVDMKKIYLSNAYVHAYKR